MPSVHCTTYNAHVPAFPPAPPPAPAAPLPDSPAAPEAAPPTPPTRPLATPPDPDGGISGSNRPPHAVANASAKPARGGRRLRRGVTQEGAFSAARRLRAIRRPPAPTATRPGDPLLLRV